MLTFTFKTETGVVVFDSVDTSGTRLGELVATYGPPTSVSCYGS